MLAVQSAPFFKVDIRSIVDRSPPPARLRSPKSPGNVSLSSKDSGNSRRSRADTTGSIRQSRATTGTAATTPATLPSIITNFPHHATFPQRQPSYASPHVDPYLPSYSLPHASHYPPVTVYPQQQQYSASASELRLPPIPITHTLPSNKRVASPHPAETPPKKKQSKWTAAEDAAIIELRGNGMKWEDISKHLQGRSAISCRLRFQNYLERRSEWDEEKKNKLARLYERFKKDMWEKIAKEMQLPWRAAEAMHWQIGEVEMAQRANVNVFHLAGQQVSPGGGNSGGMFERSSSTSPRTSIVSANGLLHHHHHHHHHPPAGYYHAHTHSLPQMHIPPPTAGLLDSPGRLRRSSVGPAFASIRPRADSARSVSALPTPTRTLLPPMGDRGGGSSGTTSSGTTSPKFRVESLDPSPRPR